MVLVMRKSWAAMGLRTVSLVLAFLAVGSCTTTEVRLLDDERRSTERLRRMDLVVEQWNGVDGW